MNRVAPLVLFLALGCGGVQKQSEVASGRRPSTRLESVERDVSLRGGSVRVVVEHEGNESWAQDVAAHVCAFLPVAEAYFDVPFHQAAASMLHGESVRDGAPSLVRIRIVGRETVMLGNVHIGAYNNTSGVFGPDRAIFVEYGRSPKGNPAVVLHELTHDWIHGKGAALKAGELGRARDDDTPAWFIEGIASMAPIEMSATRMLPLANGEERAMRKHWGQWDVPSASRDVAIVHDPRPDGRIPIFYGKSYRVQLLIERALGPEAYRALVHDVALRNPTTNDEVLALLAAHGPESGVDWHAFLSGWIFEGEYREVAPADVPRLFPPAP